MSSGIYIYNFKTNKTKIINEKLGLANNAIYGMTGGQMAPTSLPKRCTRKFVAAVRGELRIDARTVEHQIG